MQALWTVRRLLVVTWQFLPLLWAYARDRRRFIFFGKRRTPDRETQQARADRLLETFIELGPAFIKLGQLLSTRPDILPPVYIDRFSELQDAVPPAPWSETRPVIESSIGPITEYFSSFDTEAISGASLGQVYRAEIDGEPVAVKVRRPGVNERVETDLRVIAAVVPVLVPFLDEARSFSLETLTDEFATVIREEMDYEREAAMLTEIGENFRENPHVRIPRAIDSHSTDRVLTMEYIPGTKITDIETLDQHNVDRTAVAKRLERAYLQMVIEDGVFQADPHPGNLAVRSDGTIVFYDFGMSGRVGIETRREIVDFYVAVADRDIEAILDALIAMGTLSPNADRAVMGEVLELAIRDAQGEAIEDWRVQQIVERVESTVYEFPLRLPARLALVMRVATVVEGVCVTLDPDFDFISVATEFLTDRGHRQSSIRESGRAAGRAVTRAGVSVVRAAPTAERVLKRMDRNEVFVRAGLEDPNKHLDRLAKRVTLALFGVGGFMTGGIVFSFHGWDPVSVVSIVIGTVALLFLGRSLRRSGIRARPQFTRRQLQERREQ